ncbi:flagellar type III secretion system pore protein FliP [Dyella tabacisoli]|uniref:Flagellar biosynthetic protein FliP n=1 Tax=Dyella tabacisoli TaxID=2282381 RepID=A0A369UMY3_9GAMM|nr:flagellar type III secretion system pore protein FliP [Dyella tabacisoli]RDD81435.1 flagellar biosynthetic protein FliP [Dyella tabacisoli]
MSSRRCFILLVLFLSGLFLSGAACCDPIQDAIAKASADDYSPILRSFLLLTLLAFIPLLVIALTSFTRIIVVLSLLRSALGLQQTPPNSVLLTLAMFLTVFSMNPVFQAAKQTGLDPYVRHEIPAGVAVARGFEPFKQFMIRQIREEDMLAVIRMAKMAPPKTIDDVGALQLIPAFMLSELRTAFQIGFVIFLPFLLIDLVVSAILMALGMIMLPPTTISLPLKILLFLLINGWALLAQALLSSYHG